MTETELHLGELQKSIAHVADVSEDGWLMKWGDSPQNAFEIVYRKANALQVQKLEPLVSEGHRKAVLELK